MKNPVLTFVVMAIFCSCKTGRYIADQKFPVRQLQEDYKIFRGALEESHPGLYWFTSKDSMDLLFDQGYRSLDDSLTERQFRTRLLKVVAGIRCGHTTVNYSRRYLKYLDTARLPVFPLAFKVLKDTLALTGILGTQLLPRGTIVKSINDHPASFLVDTFSRYITGDAYSATGKLQTLSTYGTFGVMYKNIFGLTDSFRVRYDDNREITVPLYYDTVKHKEKKKEPAASARISTRDIQIDTSLKSAYMPVNTFARVNKLRRFFKYAFKNISRLDIDHLVIDVRLNGGGDAGNAIMLTQYLSDHSFKVADSLYAIKRSSRYRDYIKHQPLYWLATVLITRKRGDGKFHFGYFERHKFKPRKKFHYNRNIYILTGGNSFSATTLFAQELKGQKNVKIIGEETGGGAYGNSAWLLPELRLPNSRLRVTIPKFRFVMRSDLVQEGRGVMPDLYAAPDIEDIRRGTDAKIEAVKRLITN